MLRAGACSEKEWKKIGRSVGLPKISKAGKKPAHGIKWMDRCRQRYKDMYTGEGRRNKPASKGTVDACRQHMYVDVLVVVAGILLLV